MIIPRIAHASANGARFFAVALLAVSAASAATVRFALTAAAVDPITTTCPATPTAVGNFSTTSSSAFLYFVLDNVVNGDTVSVSWLDPTGKAYAPAAMSWNITSSGNFCFEAQVNIAGQTAATLPGNWSVKILDNQTTLTTLPFTISTLSIGQVDSTKCPVITLTVSVVDNTGATISGLTAGNFTLKEDGQTRPITVTQIGGGTGLSVAILLDTSLSTGTVRSQIATAADSFVNLMPASAAMAAYGFDTSTYLLQGFTTNHTLLTQQINTITLLTGGGSTAIFDAIVVAVNALSSRPGRRAVVILTDGDDNASATTVQGAIQQANTNNVAIYTIGFYSTDRKDAVLQQLATGTGGIYIPAASGNTDLTSIFQSLAQLISAVKYQITYTTNDRSVDHSVSLTATQGASTTVPVTQTISACCPPSVTATPAGKDTTPPFGSFDTPANNSTGVTGAVGVTGWALDNVGVTKVDIYRDPVPGETGGSFGYVYIGTATLVKGARPDVQAAYATYPYSDRAGWGYMLLTNFLPNNGGSSGIGNGTFRLHAIASDAAGNTTELGAPGKTITVDNAHAAKPFGTIDTPAQGGMASGTAYINFGWALTPGTSKIPTDGSTISVIVDGQTLGHPNYNNYRADIATLFPGYTNTQGAIGYYSIDTTQFPGCTHTIAWLVYDNSSRGDGIGSRFFTIGAANPPPATTAPPEELETHAIAQPRDADGAYTIDVQEFGRVEFDASAISGYLQAGDQKQDLPIGSSLKHGVLYWQLAPGFLGEYRLMLTRPTGEEIPVRIRVHPKPSV